MTENIGERLFLEYAAQEGYPVPRVIPTGPDRTPDFELLTSAGIVVCEVKHFPYTASDQKEAEKVFTVTTGHPGWTRLRDSALRSAQNQLERRRGELTLIVLAKTNPFVNLDDDAVIEAMFGREKLAIWVDPDSGAIRRTTTFLTRHGRIIHPEIAAPWVSAVAVLEHYEPDSEIFYDLVEQRVGNIPDTPVREFFDRWEAAVSTLRRERPDLDPDRTVLRMRVFENPEAERPLPRTVIAGRYDLRYGALAEGRYGPLG